MNSLFGGIDGDRSVEGLQNLRVSLDVAFQVRFHLLQVANIVRPADSAITALERRFDDVQQAVFSGDHHMVAGALRLPCLKRHARQCPCLVLRHAGNQFRAVLAQCPA